MGDGPLHFSGDNRFGRALRFLNLLDDGVMSLSISRIFMWVTVGSIVYVVLNRPEDVAALVGSVGVAMIGTGNYMYRRHVQSKKEDKR